MGFEFGVGFGFRFLLRLGCEWGFDLALALNADPTFGAKSGCCFGFGLRLGLCLGLGLDLGLGFGVGFHLNFALDWDSSLDFEGT